MNCLFELLYRRWQRLIMMTRDTHGWGAAMTQSEADVQELIDRQRIWECLLRYTRGMDRLDRDLVLSAYHPNAMEDHGAFMASCETFADQVLAFHRAEEILTQHIMSNHLRRKFLGGAQIARPPHSRQGRSVLSAPFEGQAVMRSRKRSRCA
jgi:hypothetical protein